MKTKEQIITDIIEKCFYPSPAERAAQVLHNMGVKSNELYGKEYLESHLDDAVRVSVANALRDLEVKMEEKNV